PEMWFERRFCPALHASLGGKSVPIHQPGMEPCADVDGRTDADQSGFVLRRGRERIRLVHVDRVGEEHAATIARLAVGKPGPEAELGGELTPGQYADARIRCLRKGRAGI